MNDIERRKTRHIKLSLEEKVESDIPTGFEDLTLVHNSIPEIDLSEVSTDTHIFGRRLSAPLIISAITGGTEEAKSINETLARVANDLQIGIGVGSQRIGLQQPETASSFSIVREKAPDTLVIANLGCPQLSLGWGVKEAKEAIDMVNADVLAIHMNPLQEVVQVGGDTNYRGILAKIKQLTTGVKTPIIMKETGAGISRGAAEKLEAVGVSGFEISGLGGTSWAAVEHHIARETGDLRQEYLGKALWNWGVPTACSLVEVRRVSKGTVVASGGLRTGLDMAKALSLGADAVGIAKPFLEKVVVSEDALRGHIEEIISELKASMFLVGARTLKDMPQVPTVMTGWTAEWMRARGYSPEAYARRG